MRNGRSVRTVSTAAVFPAAPAASWSSILFYEEVARNPSWLLRRLLPRPVCCDGSKSAVGNLVRCTYSKGQLVKRITAVDVGRLLAFDVVEQTFRFGRGVRLLGGAYALDRADDGAKVTLTTRYTTPSRRPEALWRLLEERLLHAFHRHMLDGMRRRELYPGETAEKKAMAPFASTREFSSPAAPSQSRRSSELPQAPKMPARR